MKLHSKWYYFSAGIGLGEALVFALAHQGLWMTVGFVGAYLNWNWAEARRLEEENGPEDKTND